jgi:DNA-binding NtrC family response regulator
MERIPGRRRAAGIVVESPLGHAVIDGAAGAPPADEYNARPMPDDSNQVDLHAQVLIVDDEPDHADVMAEALRKPGHVCTIVTGLAEAEDEIRHGNFDVIVTDLVMENETAGLSVLELAKKHQSDAETIMVTAHGDVPTAKAALQGGAYDFIEKPLDLEVFRNLVNRAAETVLLRHQNVNLQGQLDAAFGFEGIIGESPAIRNVITLIKQVAPSRIPVLITGESGTGKELIAAAIHKHSTRADKRYVAFNAAGQSETLIEDELFGHVRGAYTGAERDREGVFEYASGGTLFLDEIGDMPLAMQAKLLRVLETGEVVRLGANEPRRTDVRFVCATNHDIRKLIADGKFRDDLYFRIKGAQIDVPPLRERREDIPRLINHFIGRFSAELGKPMPSVSQPAMMRLVSYHWPGNVRELLNVVQRIVVMCADDEIDVRHIPDEIRSDDSDEALGVGSLAGVGLDKLEKEAIRQTLAMTGGNREQAARILGIGERTLYRKLKEYGLR